MYFKAGGAAVSVLVWEVKGYEFGAHQGGETANLNGCYWLIKEVIEFDFLIRESSWFYSST